MTDSQRGAIVAIIMSFPTNTSEVISYTMGKPINTREFHYVIWTTLYIFFLLTSPRMKQPEQLQNAAPLWTTYFTCVKTF